MIPENDESPSLPTTVATGTLNLKAKLKKRFKPRGLWFTFSLVSIVLVLVTIVLAVVLTHKHSPKDDPDPDSATDPSGTINLVIPNETPDNAVTISPALFSFSIEQDRWTDWAGTTIPNQFTYNALNNLREITGTAPWIRIGADSEDHTFFDPSVEYSNATFPAFSSIVPYPEASSVSVSDKYYTLVSHLPPGTHVIWGVNFRSDNISNAVAQTNAIVEAFNSDAVKDLGITLEFIEIGNEADFYGNNGGRNRSIWDIQEYVAQWTQMAINVSATANLSSTSHTKFIGCAFALSTSSTTGFSPQAAIANGLLDSTPGSLITEISQHHYSGSFCEGRGGILQGLMTPSYIYSNLSRFNGDIAAVKSRNLTYVLGETSSFACHGAPGVSDVAGAALWALDYSFYATVLGIERTHYHQGIGFKYNFIQPVSLNRSIDNGTPLKQALAPHIQPVYYAAVIGAEAIGNSSSTQLVNISTGNPYISGYAFYNNGSLSRVLLINQHAYLSTSNNASRPSILIYPNIQGTNAPASMRVKRLSVPHADATSGLMWGGQTYETSDGLVNGTLIVPVSSISDGVNITQTEVVLLSFS